MSFDIHSSHKTIFLLPLGIYLVLVYFVAVRPAQDLAAAYPPTAAKQTGFDPVMVARGIEVYVAWGCAVCHTQQIRGDERIRVRRGDAMVVPVRVPDARFGLDEPSKAEDYANANPPLLGTQRTGPDLTGVGERLPWAQWHYWHLYDPRSVSPDSVMPSYRELFSVTEDVPPGIGKGLLVIGILALLFLGLGWLLFGFTVPVFIALALGVGAGLLVNKECQVCNPPPRAGELVEGIDRLGLPPGTELYASPAARDLTEYLLSLRRPVKRP